MSNKSKRLLGAFLTLALAFSLIPALALTATADGLGDSSVAEVLNSINSGTSVTANSIYSGNIPYYNSNGVNAYSGDATISASTISVISRRTNPENQGNALTSLDISGLTSLTELSITGNTLDSLAVSGNSALIGTNATGGSGDTGIVIDKIESIGPMVSGNITPQPQLGTLSINGGGAVLNISLTNANGNGGAILINGGTIIIENSTFYNNPTANGNGGAITNGITAFTNSKFNINARVFPTNSGTIFVTDKSVFYVPSPSSSGDTVIVGGGTGGTSVGRQKIIPLIGGFHF